MMGDGDVVIIAGKGHEQGQIVGGVTHPFDDATEAAEALRISSLDLKELGLVDDVVPEPEGGAHRDWERTVANTLEKITQHLAELSQLSPTRLVETRQERYRSIGSVTEA